MTEYETVLEAMQALYEINTATEIKTTTEAGKTRPATAEDIQQLNFDICYQLAGLLNIDLSELEG